MKRIISILVLSCFLIMAFPIFIPANAAETTGEYFNVLDYVGVNGTANTSSPINGNTVITFDLTEFFGSFSAYSFEITFNYNGTDLSPLSSVSFDSNYSTLRGGFVTDHMYRYRGTFDGNSGSVFTLRFNVTGSHTVNFCSFNVYTVDSSSEPIGGQVSITGNSVSFDSGDSAFITGSPNAFFGGFSVSFENWRQYDFIDFAVTVSAVGITGVSSFFVSNVGEPFIYDIPLTVSKIQNVSSSGTYVYVVSVRADLRNLDHAAPIDSYVSINFTVSPFVDSSSNSNYVRLYSAYGVILQGQYNSSARWYQVIFNTVKSGFQNLATFIMNLDDSINSAIDRGVKSITDKLDELFNPEDAPPDPESEALNQSTEEMQESFNSVPSADELFDEEALDVVISVDTSGFINNDFLVVINSFWDLPEVLRYASLSFTLCFCSYVIFGKKG